MDLETACQFACGFWTFMAAASKDKLSDDGHLEALSMAQCMQKCTDMFGRKKDTATTGPPAYTKDDPPCPPPSCPK